VRGHSVGGGGRLAVHGGRGGGGVPWSEVPVREEALLDGNGGVWIFMDAPRCGARA
jgi:hypothetical protein